ncbi:MAG: 2-phosphosulfolactate phosphatase [archaeon]|nr:2-phosphosulfolactate phosphatase [archaeon]
MKISISFEKTITSDVSIIVDALRASTTMTLALDNFEEVIPCFTPEEAFEIAKKTDGILAGERKGAKIEESDIGNSPSVIKKMESNSKTLILTTSNGTRILKGMNSKILIGSFINAKAVAKKAIELANNEIDIVMAGVKGEFSVEDFLASGEIAYWILKELDSKKIEYTTNDMVIAGILASRDEEKVYESICKSRTYKRLSQLGCSEDIEICLMKNITDKVATYKNGKLQQI